MGLSKPSRKWFEYLTVIALVGVVAFLAVSNIYYQNRSGKHKALLYQLQILRSSINLYKLINGQNPSDLVMLATSAYKFPGEEYSRRYIDNAPMDKSGKVVDPFGNPYYYDETNGWIRSATHGYEFW